MENFKEDNKTKEISEAMEIKEIKISQVKTSTDNDININQNFNSSSIINSIFILYKLPNSQISYPRINKENFNKIFDAFNKGIIPRFESKKELLKYIKDKIKIMEELQNIIQNKYEILDIIIKFFQKNNFSFLEYFIDLYFKGLESLHSENPILDIMDKNLLQNEIIDKITDIINWVISCGFVKKKNYDFIFRKLANLQLSKNLSDFAFYEYLNLLEIFYEKKI